MKNKVIFMCVETPRERNKNNTVFLRLFKTRKGIYANKINTRYV